MRLNLYISSSSLLSRRSADTAIAGGRVLVNDKHPSPGQQISDADKVTLDGQELRPETSFSYIAFNKPPKYVTSRRRQGNNPTIYELLPQDFHHLQAVGRLDKDSSGLLLLTNDGQFTLQATHPSFGKIKRYYVETVPTHIADVAARLVIGVDLEDGHSRMLTARRSGKGIEVTLAEGRTRQIRRTFAAMGYQVSRLHRLQFGKLELGDLASGQVRKINPSDVL